MLNTRWYRGGRSEGEWQMRSEEGLAEECGRVSTQLNINAGNSSVWELEAVE
jgi:hypothetical protein